MKTIGLDASTTTVGYAFVEDKKILDVGFIPIHKESTIRDKVKATKEETTIEKDNAIAVSLNKVPEMPSIKINGKKTAIKINVVARIANVICLEPL